MNGEYKRTPIGNIPIDWKLNTVGDVIKFEGGAQPPKEHFRNEEKEGYIRLIQIRDYKTDDYMTYIPKDKARKFCTADDIMIGRYGPPIFQILKGLEGAYNVALLKAIPNEAVLNKEYARYFLSTEKLFKLIDRLSQRTSGQTGVDMEALNNYLIPTPPLKEQERIAEILSTVDCQIDDTKMIIEKCRVLKKGLMQRLLSRGIGHSEFKDSEVGEIPVGWEVKKFSDISKVNQGLQIAIENRFKERANNRLPYITIQYINDKNNKDNEFYIEDANESVICTEDDILMTRTGNTGFVVTNEHGVFHNNFFKVDFNKELLDKDYLVYYLKSKEIQSLILRYAGTTTIPDLKHSDFYRIPVVMPSIKEQKQIAQILSSVDSEIEEYENKKQQLEELKKGLMQQLLSGKIRTV